MLRDLIVPRAINVFLGNLLSPLVSPWTYSRLLAVSLCFPLCICVSLSVSSLLLILPLCLCLLSLCVSLVLSPSSLSLFLSLSKRIAINKREVKQIMGMRKGDTTWLHHLCLLLLGVETGESESEESSSEGE